MTSLTIPARRSALLLHAVSGSLLAVFVAVHLANHALAFVNLENAFDWMDKLRLVYRWPPVEMLLIACVVCQVATGPALARRVAQGPKHRTRWATTASGYYLLFFITLHTAAVFWGRHIASLDTNIYFAAAGLHAWPYSIFFSVYYFFGVLAVFVHLGQAIIRRLHAATEKRGGLVVTAAIGAIAAAVIVAAMAGFGNGMQIPSEYMSVYRN